MLLLFFILSLFNLCIIFLLRKLAPVISLVDLPGGRKTHSSPTPVIGGISIYITLFIAALVIDDWSSTFNMFILWAGIIVLVSLVDDIKHVHWSLRIVTQLIATVGVIITTDVSIQTLGDYPIIGSIGPYFFNMAFTIFAVIGITNSFNLIDGIDGLCSSLLFLIALTFLLINYIFAGQIDFFLMLTLGLLAIFIWFNLINNKFKIFLGDAGSAGLGFITAFFVISSINNETLLLEPPFALWVFLIPICDTVSVIATRISRQRNIFMPGLEHIHHIFLAMGFSKIQTLTILLVMASTGIAVGFVLNFLADAISLITYLCVVTISVTVLIRKNQKQPF